MYPGEHTAIVEAAVWERVRAILARNGKTAGASVKNKYGALLRGLIHCSCCRCAMIHSYTVKAASKRYRYYVCLAAQKKGWHTCPSKSVPAGEIEEFVVEQIKRIGRDPALIEGTLRQVRSQQDKALADLQAEERSVAREMGRLQGALKKLAGAEDAGRTAELRRSNRKSRTKGDAGAGKDRGAASGAN